MSPAVQHRFRCYRMLVVLYWVCLLFRVASSSSSGAPWQSNVGTNVLEEETYRDLPPIVFSPTGRLHSVERTVAAASSTKDASSNLIMALCCKDGVVLVTTSNTSPYIDVGAAENDKDGSSKDDTLPLWITQDTGSHRPPLSRLSSRLWMVTGGNAVDACMLREKITRMSENMQQERDGGQPLAANPIVSATLAKRVANHLQVPTQTIGSNAGRILASYALLVDGDRHCIWRIDPTGQFWKCDATAIGRGARVAETHLMDMVASKKDGLENSWSTQKALAVACACMEKALPKEHRGDKSHWQALLLSNGRQARVLHGHEIQSYLSSFEKEASD